MRARPLVAVLVAMTAVLLRPQGAVAQRAPFASPRPGEGPAAIRPYGQVAGCPEEPAAFHRCALEKMKTFDPPRTPDGHPDFRGFWNRVVVRNMENIEEHPQTIDGSGGRSAVVDPADGKIPYQPWAAARRERMFATYLNPMQICVPLGSPKQVYSPGAMRVLQTPGSFFILNDYAHTYRVTPTDGRPHVGPSIHLFEGDSRGRWEGNTLVIDVTNQRDATWIDAVGNFFSETVHVVERYTLIDKDAIHIEATVEDPRVYTRPWTIVAGWRRNVDPPLEIWESGCWEGVQDTLDHSKFGHLPYPGADVPQP